MKILEDIFVGDIHVDSAFNTRCAVIVYITQIYNYSTSNLL